MKGKSLKIDTSPTLNLNTIIGGGTFLIPILPSVANLPYTARNAEVGFSSASFSFGSVSSEGSGSIFGTKNDKPFGLGLSTNGSSVFGASASSAISKSEGSGFAALQEVTVETGEENEKVVFNADSVLFEFVDASW
ncbi:hypothetical protein PIB30_100175, partial [Stylosanthes scabra]|nr:hypothetical protein [Stylosanthes scabra]